MEEWRQKAVQAQIEHVDKMLDIKKPGDGVLKMTASFIKERAPKGVTFENADSLKACFGEDVIGPLRDNKNDAEARLDEYLSQHEFSFPLNKDQAQALLEKVAEA